MDICESWFFTAREEGIAQMFMAAGLRRCFALVLVCLIRQPGLTSRDIERGTELRQPEVSVAINYLIDRRWAEVSEYYAGDKGRPVRQFQLGTPVDRILDDLEEEKRGEFSAQLDVIEQLRTVIHEPVTEIAMN